MYKSYLWETFVYGVNIIAFFPFQVALELFQ